MLAELGAALERAADLNAIAISLWEGLPPSDGRAVMAHALRENRDALMRSSLELSAAWEEGFDAGRAFEREQSPPAESPPERHLRAVG
jgi:hypothetical protein